MPIEGTIKVLRNALLPVQQQSLFLSSWWTTPMPNKGWKSSTESHGDGCGQIAGPMSSKSQYPSGF